MADYDQLQETLSGFKARSRGEPRKLRDDVLVPFVVQKWATGPGYPAWETVSCHRTLAGATAQIQKLGKQKTRVVENAIIEGRWFKYKTLED